MHGTELQGSLKEPSAPDPEANTRQVLITKQALCRRCADLAAGMQAAGWRHSGSPNPSPCPAHGRLKVSEQPLGSLGTAKGKSYSRDVTICGHRLLLLSAPSQSDFARPLALTGRYTKTARLHRTRQTYTVYRLAPQRGLLPTVQGLSRQR